MPFDMMASLCAASQALEIVKRLREIDRGIDAAALKAQLADVTGMLADVRLGLADAQTALQEKDAEIARLVAANAQKADVVWHRGFAYDKHADGGPVGYPYWPLCLEDHVRFYRLARMEGVRGSCFCPKCKNEYQVSYHNEHYNSA